MLPFATLLAWAIGLWGGAFILRRLIGGLRVGRRFVARALAAGLLAGALSAGVRAARHAGTGTYTTWGWPRPVYTRWVSWERDASAPGARRGGPRLRGLLENAIFYGGGAAFGATVLVAAAGAARRWATRRPPAD
jgi:hypothetical protein